MLFLEMKLKQALSANCYDCHKCSPPLQVWKDVDGVLTCDPSIHPKAEPVPFLTFEEAAELAYFGAQVSFYARSTMC